MPQIRQSVEISKVDENGVIRESVKNRVLTWGDEPNYIKLYLQDIMYLSDMPKQYSALTESLLKRVSYAGDEYGMCVSLSPGLKKIICKELNWKNISTLDNGIQKLLKGKIIERVARGMYRFNPYLFGKGDWQDISKLRLEVNYDDIKGRTFMANIEYKEEENGQMSFDMASGQ